MIRRLQRGARPPTHPPTHTDWAHTHTHTHAHTDWAHSYIHMQTRAHTHTRARARTRTHAHTHTHTLTHTPVPAEPERGDPATAAIRRRRGNRSGDRGDPVACNAMRRQARHAARSVRQHAACDNTQRATTRSVRQHAACDRRQAAAARVRIPFDPTSRCVSERLSLSALAMSAAPSSPSLPRAKAQGLGRASRSGSSACDRAERRMDLVSVCGRCVCARRTVPYGTR
jgi:hypothetical protein